MTTRNAYTALTHDIANDFVVPNALNFAAAHPSLLGDIDEEKEVEPKWRIALNSFVRNNVGLLLVASAQAFFSFISVTVKILHTIDPPVSSLQLILVQMGITYVCSMIYMLATGVPDSFRGPKGVRLLLLCRGFFGFCALFGSYYSLNYLSPSDSIVLTFLVPLFTSASGALFLGETFTLKQGLASFVSICGVVLIARPPFLFSRVGGISANQDSVDALPYFPLAENGTPAQRLVAVGVGLAGALGASGAYTTVQVIGKRAHAMHSMSSYSLLCSVVAVVGLPITHEPFVIPTRWDWFGLLIIIGVFGFLAQMLLTMGLQRETAGRSTMAIYTQIVFATILERIFFKTTPPILSVIGTILILASALYVALTKNAATTPKLAKVDSAIDPDLEEGLLERSSLENTNDSTVRPYSRESLDAEETSALDPEDPSKPHS